MHQGETEDLLWEMLDNLKGAVSWESSLTARLGGVLLRRGPVDVRQKRQRGQEAS